MRCNYCGLDGRVMSCHKSRHSVVGTKVGGGRTIPGQNNGQTSVRPKGVIGIIAVMPRGWVNRTARPHSNGCPTADVGCGGKMGS